MTQAPPPIAPDKSGRPARSRLRTAALTIFVERALEALWPAAALLAAFAGLSLLGVWAHAPAMAHWATLIALALGLGWTVRRASRTLRWPTRAAVERRLELDSGLPHRPVSGLEDRPVDASADTAALWAAHRVKMAAAAAKARARRPNADIPSQDRFALRLAAAMIFIAGLIVAGPDAGNRISQAFVPGAAQLADRTAAFDLWIEPPTYTNAPPIYLARAGENLATDGATITAPIGSTIQARVAAGASRPRLTVPAQSRAAKLDFDRTAAGGRQASGVLGAAGDITLRIGRQRLVWRLDIRADARPRIQWIAPPEADEDGQLLVGVAISDDYGVERTELRFRLAADQARPADAAAFAEETLAQRDIAALPGATGARGEALVDIETDIDLRQHVWAGLEVEMRAIAIDGAGQETETDMVRLTLPTREFFVPVARAVLEQRQTLAVAPDARSRPLRAFDAMTVAPDIFFERAADYLSMRSIYWRIFGNERASTDDLAPRLWALALSLEDGDLALARRALEEAIEAVRAALERGEDPERIAELLERVRTAMERYVRALAARALDGDPLADFESGGENLGMEDLEDMLSAIDELSDMGSRDAAQQLLSEFERMMQNLQIARGGAGGDGDPLDETRDQLSELSDLIGRQRGLLDDTFQREQSRSGETDDLASQQDSLEGALDDLAESLGDGEEGSQTDAPSEGQGGAAGGDVDEALGEAGRAMQRAEEALRRGDFDSAGAAQGEALENLRDGAQALSDEIMDELARRSGRNQGQGQTDPLGRPTGRGYDFGDNVEVPSEFERARVRELLEELRRRAGERGRTPEELDYIERLLRRF